VGRVPKPAFLLSLACLTLILTPGLMACSRILYVRNPGSRVFTEPTIETSKPFFFLGFVGPDQHVIIEDLCLGKDADQIITRYSGSDVLNGIFTLGIYAPRSVQVWCRL
jgi:hypothetical protein